MKKEYYYFVYILTNLYKTVFYVGVTNSIKRRIIEHADSRLTGFSHRYRCQYLIYYEKFTDVNSAISREKQLKKWGKVKKRDLISKHNPSWKFLNEQIMATDDEYL